MCWTVSVGGWYLGCCGLWIGVFLEVDFVGMSDFKRCEGFLLPLVSDLSMVLNCCLVSILIASSFLVRPRDLLVNGRVLVDVMLKVVILRVIFELAGECTGVVHCRSGRSCLVCVILSIVSLLMVSLVRRVVNVESPSVGFGLSANVLVNVVAMICHLMVECTLLSSVTGGKVGCTSRGRRGLLVVKKKCSTGGVVGALRASLGKGCSVVNVVSSGEGHVNCSITKIGVVNGEGSVRGVYRGRRVSAVFFAVMGVSGRGGGRVLRVYGGATTGIGMLPSLERVVSSRGLCKDLESVRVRSLLKETPMRLSGGGVGDLVGGGIILMANKKKSVNRRLYERVVLRNPGRLLVLSVCRGDLCGVRLRLGSACPGSSVGTVVTGVESGREVFRVFRGCSPRVIFRTTTRGRIPLVRGGPARTVGGGMFKACGLIGTYSGCRAGHFVLVSASGTIGPAGVVNTAGEVYRVVVRTGSGRDRARFMTMHFKGILKDGKSIMPLFGGRVTTNNPMAMARGSVAEFFVAVPRTMTLMLRSVACTGNKRVFMLGVNRPMGVCSLTGDLVRLSKLALKGSVSVAFANLEPKRGLCRRVLVSRRGLRNAKRRGVFVARPVSFAVGSVRRGLSTFERVVGGRVASGRVVGRAVGGRIPACERPRRIGKRWVV